MGKILIHSMVDVITNSSTELFCYIKDKTKKQVEDIIKSILNEFECEAVDIYVEENPWEWDEETEEEYQAKDKVAIIYGYEVNHPPCKMIRNRIKEIFGENYINAY